jgi:radical SAM protein with 4Fe4S-binding SPASM domain
MEVDLHVTNRCNLKCKHCVYTSGEWDMPDMTLETVKKIIPALKKLGVEEVHITGGEPLVNKEFFEIARCLHENGFGTRVQTNGILITPDIAKRLKECGIEYVLISIDGLEKTHNSFRNNDKSFDYAIKAVKICLEAGLYTRVNTVINKSNVQDLPELIKYINNLKPDQHSFFYLTPVGRGKNIKNLMLSLEEWKEVEKIVEKSGRENKCIEKIRLQNVIKNNEDDKKCRDDNCLILANGDVYHCVFFIYSPYKLGNIYNEDLYEIWTKNIDKVLEETSNEKILSKQCNKQKQNCQCNCSGLAYNLTGSVKACDPRCNPEKNLIPSCIRTYIKMK